MFNCTHLFNYFKQVSIFGQPREVPLPNKNTYAQDYWGYYNGANGYKNTNNDLQKNIASGSSNPNPLSDGCMIPSDIPVSQWGYGTGSGGRAADRTPSLEYARLGSLASIQYPSGGLVKFDYDLHSFGNTTPADVSNSILVSNYMGSDTLKGAGLRIREIQHYPDAMQSKYMSKKYIYAGAANSRTSGKLMYDMSFSYLISYSDGNPGQVFSSGSRYPISQSANGNPVGYTMVSEYDFDSDNNAYNGNRVYEFHNQVDARYDNFCFNIPLAWSGCNSSPSYISALNCQVYTLIGTGNGIAYDKTILQSTAIPNWFSQKNGYLLRKYTYNNTGILQEYENNLYSDVSDNNINRIQIPMFTIQSRLPYDQYPALFQYYLNSDWYRLLSKSITTYPANDANGITKKIVYDYHPIHHLVSQSSTNNSKDEQIVSQYKYPSDFVGISPVYQQMVAKNMLNPIVEQIESNTTKNIEISKTNNDYVNFGTNSSDLSRFLVGKTIKTIGGASNLPVDASFTYNQLSNIVEILPRSGVATLLIWGYNDLYPVAQITGINNSQLQTALSAAGLTINSFQSPTGATQALRDADINNKMAQLRNSLSASFPLAQLQSFTYKLLVGKTTQSTPNGLVSSFNYDNFNRVLSISNHVGNTIKRYQYNYRPQ